LKMKSFLRSHYYLVLRGRAAFGGISVFDRIRIEITKEPVGMSIMSRGPSLGGSENEFGR
jgi:hypothetical protein